MRHLSIIGLILLLLVLPSCKYFNKKDKAKAELAALHAQQDSIRIIDSIRVAQEQLAAIEASKLEEAKKTEAEQAIKNKFNIIVGSFKTPEYAKRMAEDYQKKGYNTNILKMKGSTFELVSAEAHESMKKAFARQKEFQNNIEKDAWVYIVN
jgi:DNA repair photolyase